MGYLSGVQQIESSASKAVVVTPSDTVYFAKGATKGLYVGVSGDVSVRMTDDITIVYKNLASGMIHPISCIRVNLSSTTATSIIAVY